MCCQGCLVDKELLKALLSCNQGDRRDDGCFHEQVRFSGVSRRSWVLAPVLEGCVETQHPVGSLECTVKVHLVIVPTGMAWQWRARPALQDVLAGAVGNSPGGQPTMPARIGGFRCTGCSVNCTAAVGPTCGQWPTSKPDSYQTGRMPHALARAWLCTGTCGVGRLSKKSCWLG